jgi:hypothetical protein
MRYTKLEPRFVNNIPREITPGVLYISIEYATAIHSCCCGCGEEVVTPFSPTDWQLIFDGETVSLWPSVGNWDFSCRSHYIIKHNEVIEAKPWSDRKIKKARARDKTKKAFFFGIFERPDAFERYDPNRDSFT